MVLQQGEWSKHNFESPSFQATTPSTNLATLLFPRNLMVRAEALGGSRVVLVCTDMGKLTDNEVL